MYLPLILGFLASLLLVPTDNKSDREKLQGEWKLESGLMAGEKPPEEFIKNFSITFKGETWAVSVNGQEEKGTYKENATKKPKEITFVSDSGSERQGIYDLDGDNFKICVSEPGGTRPTEFDSKAGSQSMYLVFKRKK